MPGASRKTRVAESSHVFGLPRVRELPRRLEPAARDTFGGLVGLRATGTLAVHPRAARV